MFSLSGTKYFCFANLSSTGLLWLQLATPFMYFFFWAVLLGVQKVYRRKRSDASLLFSSNSFALTDRLIEQTPSNIRVDSDSGEDFNANPISEHEQRKLLCRQLRFIRTFELLLLLSYETLTEQALQLINCISVGACGRVLAEYPDVRCPDSSSYIPLLIAAVLILVYAAAFPLYLWHFLRKLQQLQNSASVTGQNDFRRAEKQEAGGGEEEAEKEGKEGEKEEEEENEGKENREEQHRKRQSSALPKTGDDQKFTEAKYGVFYDHFKSKFWWWEIKVL